MHVRATIAAALSVVLTGALAVTLPGCSTAAPQPPASTAQAAIQPAFAGVYGGSYTCIDGEHGFYLDITRASPTTGGGYDVAGVLGFFPTVTGQGGPAGMAQGSFKVSGTLGPDGALAMTAGDWLIQPPDYGAANLEGTLQKTDGAGYILRGKPVVRGRPDACNDLIATQFLP